MTDTTTSRCRLEDARKAADEALYAYQHGCDNVFDEATRLANTLALLDLAESLRALTGRTD